MGCCNEPTRWIPPFPGWTAYNPTIPKMYWDTVSQEQRIHALCAQLHKLCCYADMLGLNVSITHDEIEELRREFDLFKANGFVEYYRAQVEKWIRDNLEYIYRYTAKQVYFGLTLDGHFVAYIPESWEEIVFDTGYNYGTPEYGRLILKYDVDSPYNVQQHI